MRWICFLLLVLTAFAQNDPLASFDPNRRLGWSQAGGYGSDTWQYDVIPSLSNAATTHVWSGPGLTNVLSTETGTNTMWFAESWQIQKTSSVTVAIIDFYGFATNHPDLVNNLVSWTNVYTHGLITPAHHGTGVASLVGAEGDNGIGLVGACWKVPMIFIQCDYRNTSGGIPPNYAIAIDTAVKLGAKVVAIPNDMPGNVIISNSLRKAALSNVVFVVAARNEYFNHDTGLDYPTTWRMAHVLTVTTSTRDGSLLAGGAGFGSQTVFASVLARRIPVATATDYGFDTGTSFATGRAAGLVALVRARFPQDNITQLRARLARVTPLGHPTITGGLLNARRALGFLPPAQLVTE